MKERPILFSGPMVRAILEGRKTQTRRVLVPQPVDPKIIRVAGDKIVFMGRDEGFYSNYWPTMVGVPGDRLWVRETFATGIPGCPGGITYRADHLDPRGDGPANPIRWTPSIFMPRGASRITLEVVEVRVQQLRDITDDDARAEGAEPEWRQATHPAKTYRGGFASLWDSINAARGYGWDKNPWVRAITFRDITTQAKAEAA